jgi:hypothetical protein
MNRATKALFSSGLAYSHYALGKAIVYRDQSKAQHSWLQRQLLRQSMRDQALVYSREVRWMRYAK